MISLALDWLDDRNHPLSRPFLAGDEEGQEPDEEEDTFFAAAQSIEELREHYTELLHQKGTKRDVVDRIIEGDWRSGISLYQLAMAEVQYLYDHPNSHRWTALKVVPLKNEDDPQEPDPPACIPRFHPATFLQNLQNDVLPDVKAHYNLDRHATLPLLLLRIFILESPYNTSLGITMPRNPSGESDLSRTVFVAFPDASPHVYISLYTNNSPPSGETTRSLRKVLQDSIPKAFSRPGARYTFQPTNLTTRTLESLCRSRGAGRTNAAAGGWSIYAEERKKNTPLNVHLPPQWEHGSQVDEPLRDAPQVTGIKRPIDELDGETTRKRRKAVAQARFGNYGLPDDRAGIERLDIRFEDPFPAIPGPVLDDENDEGNKTRPDESQDAQGKRHGGRRSTLDIEMDRLAHDDDDDDAEDRGWIPDVRMTFHGSHVFAGIRELVEAGIVDGERMPGWMTGEEGVSIGVVKSGRIRGFKGSGI